MSEMVERVARAIDKAGEMACHDGSPPDHEEMMALLARAAIEAMREPTENMLFVGSNEEAGFTARNLLQSWQLMIEEALKD